MKRTYARCPCDTCIVLAVCKTKTDFIQCQFLEKYIRTGIEYHGRPHQKKNYRKRKLESIFGKKIDRWQFTNIYKVHTDLTVWWKK